MGTVDYINLQGLGASTDNFFTVSQPFTAAHAEKRIFLNFKGTTSSAACSGVGYAMVRLLNANASKDTPDRLVKSRMRWQHKCDDIYKLINAVVSYFILYTSFVLLYEKNMVGV